MEFRPLSVEEKKGGQIFSFEASRRYSPWFPRYCIRVFTPNTAPKFLAVVLPPIPGMGRRRDLSKSKALGGGLLDLLAAREVDEDEAPLRHGPPAPGRVHVPRGATGWGGIYSFPAKEEMRTQSLALKIITSASSGAGCLAFFQNTGKGGFLETYPVLAMMARAKIVSKVFTNGRLLQKRNWLRFLSSERRGLGPA